MMMFMGGRGMKGDAMERVAKRGEQGLLVQLLRLLDDLALLLRHALVAALSVLAGRRRVFLLLVGEIGDGDFHVGSFA